MYAAFHFRISVAKIMWQHDPFLILSEHTYIMSTSNTCMHTHTTVCVCMHMMLNACPHTHSTHMHIYTTHIVMYIQTDATKHSHIPHSHMHTSRLYASQWCVPHSKTPRWTRISTHSPQQHSRVAGQPTSMKLWGHYEMLRLRSQSGWPKL